MKRYDKELIQDTAKMPEEETQMSTSDYLVAFSGLAKSYCIGIVDMVSSTKISSEMNEIEWCKYYEIFLNSMARILQRYGGKVIKNQGDSLLYYFPESSKPTSFSLMSCLESALAMIKEHETMCETMKQISLPSINYRVSLDYGKVVIMKSSASRIPDLIGPPVNMCAKINHLSSPNGIVIGGDLFQYVKEFKEYRFSQKDSFSIGLKYSYPVYGLSKT
ncbi:MAG: adenylate/guanylate cyclase domain-containing protein [Nitrosopumilaceae archaeon]|nr:adenylate/guanylate cyclase domain-containing protein [Nitrosopumilaceae archaeon]